MREIYDHDEHGTAAFVFAKFNIIATSFSLSEVSKVIIYIIL